jgi:DNA-binding transcriptional ArsR family regulator
MRPVTSIDDPRYVKAMSHPLRVRILAILQERTASPVELAQVLEGTLGTVSYHVRTLHQLGLIELVDETRVRGAVEHHYKAKARPQVTDEAWEQAPPIAKQAAVGSSLQVIDHYARASAAAGGFDHADAALIRLSLKLDAKGWQQLAKEVKRLLERAQRIEADAGERLKRGAAHEQEPIDVGLVTMMFEAIALGGAIDGADRRHRRRGSRSAATADVS